jgi:hypothetical protein
MTNAPGEQQFTVRIPGAHPVVEDRTQIFPVQQDEAHDPLPYDAEPAVRKDTLPSRFGAALLWMAVGWWLFIAVRVGEALADVAWVDGRFRAVPATKVADAFRAVTDLGRAELVAATGLSVLATLVLFSSRGRRGLGVVALVVAAGTIVLTAWRLLG